MPGVLIEAGLSGLCVVATRVPGVSDVIRDGVTGSLVPVSDFGALVDETRRLLSDPARRKEMGRAARDRCDSQFSMEASVASWRDLLSRVGPR
jgi:glycosyltransferase involved in cell wall biosynthesis